MSKYDLKGINSVNDTSDENEKVLKPLLNNGAPNQAVFSEEIQTSPSAGAKDHYNIIYFIFIIFGIAILLPWNVFINAEDYFVKYKLDVNGSRNASYRTDFTFIVGSIGQSTNVLMNVFNIMISFGGNPKNRIPYTILLSAACIFLHVILAIIDTSTWPLQFFITCCVSVFVMYVATGIMNSCVFYVAAILPMEYVNAIILGNNLSGCFTAIMNIVSKLTSPDLRISAIYYFLSAFIALLIAFISYFVMQRMAFYKYWNRVNQEMNKNKVYEQDVSSTRVPYLKILKKIWVLLFCIWLNFFSTLSIFPVFLLKVEPISDDFIIPKKWFQDVVTFVTFNFLVTIGNLIPKLIKRPGPKWIPVAVITRAILVFLFFIFSNYNPENRNLPVVIQNDYVYWAGCALSPLIFGYFTSLLMMYTPQQVEPEYAGTAAMMAGLTLVIGVISGLQFTVVLEQIALIKF